MRSFLARWLMPVEPANPARELAMIGHRQHREHVKQTARAMRQQLGLPPLTVLNQEGN
jgi:Cft2 family RNA processing exonuclease